LQSVRIISEGGLYNLIMGSDEADAEPFQVWVPPVVLPAIRKLAGYVMYKELERRSRKCGQVL